jgi:hypothetical protein
MCWSAHTLHVLIQRVKVCLVRYWLFTTLILMGCNLGFTAITPNPTPTTLPESTAIPVSTLPSVENDPVSGWRSIAPGLEQRDYIPLDEALLTMTALRIDPALYTFRAHYRPGEPLTLRQWQSALPDAVALINANFFAPDHTIQGLLVSDGVTYGQSYRDRGGMFSVANGSPRIQALIYEPYTGEGLEQAVQAFPVLVYQGAAAYTNASDVRRTRRSVIGQDAQGRIVLMATPFLGLGLSELSAYLPTLDIGFTTAFNLDGGGSTLLHIAPSSTSVVSLDAVPAVLAIYPK